jgi:hypothetical protein
MSEPLGTTTVSLSHHHQYRTSLDSLTFNEHNWNIPQEVVVYARDDFVDEDDGYFDILHRSESDDHNYGSSSVTYAPTVLGILPVLVLVNDQSGVVFSSTSLSVAESGLVDSFEVRLSSNPDQKHLAKGTSRSKTYDDP